ncbi:sigma-70 family RNA polymerase sigma factor [Streptomyces sp. RS2]|uniref:RNA polymerase sigma factor n=1 Tax=Streptomyces sp. RS2 TaxID=1451205 RepID=UPI0021F883BE|nr:sigma-70 family RNA polymerase sigma factor [Streptomyces sp. RS2]MCW1100092.1 sigma-70 family RNA polymerase sigma factor [Streptomyces sp. RS2]
MRWPERPRRPKHVRGGAPGGAAPAQSAAHLPKQERRADRIPVQSLTSEEQNRYDEFFRSEFTPLTRHVIFLGAAPEEAKDAAQSALIDLLANWNRVQAPRPWCRKAAANHFLRSDIKVNKSLRLARDDYSARRGMDPYSLSSPLEEWEFVLDFVENHLEGAQRQVMAWHIDGFEPKAIAEQLKMNPATVRSNLRHARKRLASALAKEHPELARSMGDAEGTRT